MEILQFGFKVKPKRRGSIGGKWKRWIPTTLGNYDSRWQERVVESLASDIYYNHMLGHKWHHRKHYIILRALSCIFPGLLYCSFLS